MDTDTAGHENPEDALTAARRLGRQQTESFDLRLRDVESKEREARLAEAAWRPRREHEALLEEGGSQKVVQLEARVSELAAYARAVDDSLPWRMIQAFRRLLGRAW